MSKVRLKFSKLGMGKYISHLDLLRTFTRSIQRSGLPVRYSQGFNPHQLITFSLPLALGTMGEEEFVDIDFEDNTDKTEIVNRLNQCLPPDIKILDASVPQIKAKDIVAAEYVFDMLLESAVNKEDVLAFFDQKEIEAVKKTKKGEKSINLAEFIHRFEILEICETGIKINLVLSAGGENNIKPGIVAEKLCEYIKNALPENTEITRKQIFYSENGEIGSGFKKFC